MDESSLKFLKKLLETPGPSGFEGAIQGVVKEYAKTFAEKIETDLHGNVILSRNGSSPRRVMFAGHCDQIGLIVSHIDDNGFIYSQTIGPSTFNPMRSARKSQNSKTSGSISAPRIVKTPRAW
jgi:putative aminopeptidase FrvX